MEHINLNEILLYDTFKITFDIKKYYEMNSLSDDIIILLYFSMFKLNNMYTLDNTDNIKYISKYDWFYETYFIRLKPKNSSYIDNTLSEIYHLKYNQVRLLYKYPILKDLFLKKLYNNSTEWYSGISFLKLRRSFPIYYPICFHIQSYLQNKYRIKPTYILMKQFLLYHMTKIGYGLTTYDTQNLYDYMFYDNPVVIGKITNKTKIKNLELYNNGFKTELRNLIWSKRKKIILYKKAFQYKIYSLRRKFRRP